MAGGQFGWIWATLLQPLLGVNLVLMPPTEARTLSFVTLVMRGGVGKGLSPELERHKLAGGGRGRGLCWVWGSGGEAGLGGDDWPAGLGVQGWGPQGTGGGVRCKEFSMGEGFG